MSKRVSFADIAVNTALIIMSAAAAVLLCIYIFRGKPQEDNYAEPTVPHVIGAAESETAVTEPPAVSETSAVSEQTEVTTEQTVVPSGDYDPAFFERAFFIGDSLSVGLINYEFLKPENVFAQAGITPSSVVKTQIDGVSVYQKVSEFDPEYICIMLGTNGLSYLKTDDMAEKLGTFIDELRKLCPNAEIAVVSIPAVTQKHEEEKPEKLEMITEYNERLQKLAEDKSTAFADIFPLLRDETGYLASDYAEHDGLHLKIHAYPVILNTVQSAITEFYGEKQQSSETTASTGTASEAVVSETAAVTSPTASESVSVTVPAAAVSETAAPQKTEKETQPASEAALQPPSETLSQTVSETALSEINAEITNTLN